MDTLRLTKVVVDTLNHVRTIYLVNTSRNNLFDVISLLVTIVALLLTYYKLKREIGNSKYLANLKNNFSLIEKINELFGSLLYELESDSYTKIYDREPASRQHSEIEAKLLGILDNNITIQRRFSDCLTKYKYESIRSVPEWIEELKTLKDRVTEELRSYGQL